MTLASLATMHVADVRAATPVASPATALVRIGVGGGGAVQNGSTIANLTIAAWSDRMGAVGGSMRVEQPATDGIAIDIATREIVAVTPLSEMDPTLVRVTGWGTLNGAGDYPFALDIHDTSKESLADTMVSLVFGRDALPFFQDGPVKQCDCVGYGYNMRGPLTSGGIIVQRS